MLFHKLGQSKVHWRKERDQQNGMITREARSREFVREPSFIRQLYISSNTIRKREIERPREKMKEAMLLSVPFVDDKLTSQQVLVLEVLYERLCIENVGFAGRVAPETDLPSQKIVYEKGERGTGKNKGDDE